LSKFSKIFTPNRKIAGLVADAELEQSVSFLQLTGTSSVHSELPGHPLRIMYVAAQFDYADRSRGLSFHEPQTLHCLLHCGHQVIRFDFEEISRVHGTDTMNLMLKSAVAMYRPQIVMFLLHRPGIYPEVAAEISRDPDVITVGVFGDDLIRFDSFSKQYAGTFDWIATDWGDRVEDHRAAGQDRVVHRPYSCNHFFYRPQNSVKNLEASFVGLMYGNRPRMLSELERAGVPLSIWGQGTKAGRVSQQQMVSIFDRSKINLDLMGRKDPNVHNEIRAKMFETTGTGGFTLTHGADLISDYFEIGEEIAVYSSNDEIPSIVDEYLRDDDKREKIAAAGRARTLADHTMEQQMYKHFELFLEER